MAGYNLSKMAKKQDGLQPYNSRLQEQSNDMGISTKESDNKNINLRLPIKDKDNTIPYEKQLEANRKNKDGYVILEKSIEKSDYNGNKREMQEKKINVSPINVLSEEFDQKKAKAFKKAEDKLSQDLDFWDKYVGEQLVGENTKVDANVSNSQLQNNPDRFSFKNNKTDVRDVVNTTISKMAQGYLKDADALLFHIYATASVENRDLTENEKEFINRINKEKEIVLAENYNSYFDTMQLEIKRQGNAAIVVGNGEIFVNDDGTEAIFDKHDNIIQNIMEAQSEFYDTASPDNECQRIINRNQ